MTVTSTLTRVTYAGDGSASPMPVTFPFFDDDELEVIERTIATGAEAVKTPGSDYSVTGGEGATGTVTPAAAVPATVSWTIRRRTRRTQEISYPSNDPFPAKTHEEGLDRAVMRDQEMDEEFARTLQFPVTDDPSTYGDLPNSEDRASKVLGFDAAGKPIATAGPTVDTSVLLVVAGADPGHVNGRIWIDTGTAGKLIARQSDGAQWTELWQLTTATDLTDLARLAQINTFTAKQILSGAALDFAAFVDVASAGTCDIGAAASNFVRITGTTTINGLGTANPGVARWIRFAGALTLTHNPTSLILPNNGSNITTAANDRAFAVSLGSGNWIVLGYQRADGTALNAGAANGQVVQYVESQSAALATGTGTIPADDTIPQSSEGNALAALDVTITPKAATNLLVVRLNLHLNTTSGSLPMLIAALFKDSDANALAAAAHRADGGKIPSPVTIEFVMTAGTTSAITFKVRYGGSAASTAVVNGDGTPTRLFGGKMFSSLSVTEVKA